MDLKPRTQVLDDLAESKPTKPSKPGFVGFDGAILAESPEIGAKPRPLETGRKQPQRMESRLPSVSPADPTSYTKEALILLRAPSRLPFWHTHALIARNSILDRPERV
jgi:hypothetical protein